MVLTRSQASREASFDSDSWSTGSPAALQIDLDPPDELEEEARVPRVKRVKFPLKLWELAESDEVNSIKWCKDGKAVVIDARELQYELRKQSLGLKTANYNSFIRQLNIYGFRKINCLTDFLEYEHPYFNRDKATLNQVTRKKPSRIADESDTSSVSSVEIKNEVSGRDSTEQEIVGPSPESTVVEEEEETTQTGRHFGTFYVRYAYFGKRRGLLTRSRYQHELDGLFADDLPADVYSF